MAQDTLGRNISFPIYNADGTPFQNLVIKNATVESVVMSLGDKISGDVYYKDNSLNVSLTEYVIVNGVKYILINPPTIVREGVVSESNGLYGMTKYSFVFYHPMCLLSNFPFSDVAVTNDEKKYLSQNKTFSWIGTPIEFIAKINKNLENTEWIVVKSDRFPEEKEDELSGVLSFTNNTIADALKALYDTWNVPYIVDKIEQGQAHYREGKRFVVVVGISSNEIFNTPQDEQLGVPFVFKMGQGVGLKNNSRTPRNNKIVTRISGQGSDNNIPYGYPQIIWYGDQDWSYTINNQSGMQDITLPSGEVVQAMSYPIYEGIVGGKWVKLIKHPFTRKNLMPSVYTESVFNKISQYKEWENGVSPIPVYNQTLADLKHSIDIRISNETNETVILAYQALKSTLDAVADTQGENQQTIVGGVQSSIHYDGVVHKGVNGLLDGYLDVVDGDRIYDEIEFEEVLDESKYETSNPNFNPNGDIIDYYDAISDSSHTYPNEINPLAPSYEFHEFEDVKPELGSAEIVSATPLDDDLQPIESWDYTVNDDGEIHPSYFKIKLPILSFDLYACAAITEEMQINMRSGNCLGCTFTVQVDWDDYKNNFYDQAGNFVPDGDQRNLDRYPKSNTTEIEVVVQKDNNTFGTLLPNIYQYPQPNDEFVILGISLPEEYITNAEQRLDEEMKSYMLENNIHYFDYPLKFDEYFLATHTNILEQIKLNTVIHFEYVGETLELFVKQITIKYGNTPLPQYDITLTDDIEVSLNQIGQVAESVERLSTLISILRQSYSRNVWNELSKKLSKADSDTAHGVITFLQGLLVGSGVYGIDGDGKANFNEGAFGKLTAQEAHFFNLIIDEVKSVGGQLVVTPANCVIDKVEETSEAYKCYFRASDSGREINNEFEIGDQALHYEFDVTEGTSRNYWRLVIGKSTETIEKEIDGVAVDCHWVLLSKSDCKTDSDEPKSGDSLSMFGNRTDVTRQNGIVISAYNIPFIDTAPYLGQMVGIQAPLFASYKGVDSYEITQANRVNVIASNGNLFRGQVTIEHGSTLADGRPVNDLGTEDGNLLRNTYFGGDYESEPSDATVMMTADTPLWSDPLKHWEVTGEVSVTDYADAKSGRCAVLTEGQLSQSVEMEDGEWYMLSFHASGTSLTVSIGESGRTVVVGAGRTRYDIAFQGDGNDVSFSGTCILSDIILTRGTLPVEWERSPLDPDKAKADDMANDYLRKAISEASTSILGGLVLSQIIKVGSYRLNEAGTRYEMNEETGGMSGAMNHEHSPFLWGGGDMVQAIHTIDKYKRNPAYEATPEEVAAMAQFVVTHGGRAILNDVILRGYIYALGGKFKGAVEALSGIFKNITTPNGSFSIDADGTAKIANLLVENFGKIASAIFRGDYMLSQYGRAADTDAEDDNYEDFDINNPDGLSAWRPNIYLNFRTGKARLVNADIIGNICMPPLHVTSENFASLFEESNNRYYLRDWHLSMPAQSLQLEYLPADHDTVLCAQVLTSNYDWTHEGLTVTIVNISGRDYYYEEVMNWSTPTFRYSSIGDKTISQFQLLARPLEPWGYHVLPTLLSSRNI